ncbi:glucan biosynthesis protein C [Acidovorax sp. 69]|uniref:acyltransferase family protein n=1 Tax=Acidovorax sp. 69 TaxID=2035202 RepID=UPI000CA82EAD|nr:acyltransferase family protein [Acidovorax sp. 69]PJI97810.1 glucan biosynthesis protein C [Acidovorax sp. 69]
MNGSTPSPGPAAPRLRVYALDNLRATMMWLGIVLHVSVIYMSRPSPLPWHDNLSTPVADLLVAVIHAFRMPVFFILAGFFVSLLVHRRGLAGMVRHRLRRLGLPFVVFWPPLFVLCAMLGLAFLHRMADGTWGLDRSLLPPSPNVPKGPSTMHLWFLWMLLWLAALTPVLWATVCALPTGLQRTLGHTVTWLGGTPLGLIALTLPLAWMGAGYDHGVVTPSGSFLPPLAEWLHNGLFYAFGLCLYAQQKELMMRYQKHWPMLAGLGLASFVITAVLSEVLAQPEASAFALVLITGTFSDILAAPVSATRHLQFWMALAYNSASWLWSFALIGFFLRHVGHTRPWLTYLADSSYWVYLVHLPMTIGLGALMYGLPIPVLAKMILNVLATTALCLATYHLGVRFTAVGQLLNGHRHTRNFSGDPAHAT